MVDYPGGMVKEKEVEELISRPEKGTVDFFPCPIGQIKNIKADLTIIGGKIVYSSEKQTR
jgi:predicted amidohydrolase YtcJ